MAARSANLASRKAASVDSIAATAAVSAALALATAGILLTAGVKACGCLTSGLGVDGFAIGVGFVTGLVVVGLVVVDFVVVDFVVSALVVDRLFAGLLAGVAAAGGEGEACVSLWLAEWPESLAQELLDAKPATERAATTVTMCRFNIE